MKFALLRQLCRPDKIVAAQDRSTNGMVGSCHVLQEQNVDWRISPRLRRRDSSRLHKRSVRMESQQHCNQQTRTIVMRHVTTCVAWVRGRVAADEIVTLPSCELARRAQSGTEFVPSRRDGCEWQSLSIFDGLGRGHQHVAHAKNSRCPLPRCSAKLLDVACTSHLSHYIPSMHESVAGSAAVTRAS